MVAGFKKKKKRSIGRFLLFHVGGFLVLLVLVVLMVANVKMYQRKQELSRQISSLQTQVKNIQTANDHLQQGIGNADNSQYIEKVAREELDLQKQGETTVSFIMPKSTTQNVDIKQQNALQTWFSGTWQWLKDAF